MLKTKCIGDNLRTSVLAVHLLLTLALGIKSQNMSSISKNCREF